MDVPTLNGNLQPSAQCPNLERFLWLPAELGPGMTDEDWQAEIDTMFKASKLTRKFVDGNLSPEDFEDALNDLGYDPHQLGDMWEAGVSLGY